MTPRLCLILAGLLGASAVALGAYHAHGLSRLLERRGVPAADIARRVDNCDTAVKYQLAHALALVGVAALLERRRSRALTWTVGLMLAGVALFSGGLYLIVFTGKVGHWAIVPSGGMLLILSWLTLAASGRTGLTTESQRTRRGQD